MHLYFYTRGINQQVELWKILAQSQFFKWVRINELTKKEETHLVQGALRPSVLGAWEYVFPEEALPEVLNMFGIKTNDSYGFSKAMTSARLGMLRRLFGAKKIPKKILKQANEMNTNTYLIDSYRALTNCVVSGVSIHPIGIKKDKRGKLHGYIQELL